MIFSPFNQYQYQSTFPTPHKSNVSLINWISLDVTPINLNYYLKSDESDLNFHVSFFNMSMNVFPLQLPQRGRVGIPTSSPLGRLGGDSGEYRSRTDDLYGASVAL